MKDELGITFVRTRLLLTQFAAMISKSDNAAYYALNKFVDELSEEQSEYFHLTELLNCFFKAMREYKEKENDSLFIFERHDDGRLWLFAKSEIEQCDLARIGQLEKIELQKNGSILYIFSNGEEDDEAQTIKEQKEQNFCSHQEKLKTE